MGSIFMINPFGHEVPVNDFTYEQLLVTGRIKNFNRQVFCHQGRADNNRICLMLNTNGIGDDIHSMPAIYAKRRQGYEIHISGLERFTAPIFESLGCKIVPSIGIGEMKEKLTEYHQIYSMKMWCIEHDFDSRGEITLTRFEQFARYLSVNLPEKFSFINHLLPNRKEPRRDIVYLSLVSSTVRRSYGREFELMKLFQGYDVRALGGVGKNAVTAKSFAELVDLVYNAKCVIAVDNGILNLALALGVPTVGIFGPTDEKCIMGQFGRYLDMSKTVVVKTDKRYSCQMPCSFQPARGYGIKGKCLEESYSDCLQDITAEEIFEASKKVL